MIGRAATSNHQLAEDSIHVHICETYLPFLILIRDVVAN